MNLKCSILIGLVQYLLLSSAYECRWDKISGKGECSLEDIFTLPKDGSYYVETTIAASATSHLQYFIEVTDCQSSNQDECVVAVLLLKKSEYKEYKAHRLRFEDLTLISTLQTSLANKTVLFPSDTQYHFIVDAKTNVQSISFSLKLHYYLPPKESCIGWIATISCIVLIILVTGITIAYLNRNNIEPDNEVPKSQKKVATHQYLAENFTMPNCFGGKRILSDVVEQPLMKFNYWYWQNLLYTWPFFPQHNDPLPKGQRIICMFAIVAFNMFLQVTWNPSQPTVPVLIGTKQYLITEEYVQFLWRIPVITISRLLFAWLLRLSVVVLICKEFWGKKIESLNHYDMNDPSLLKRSIAYLMRFFSSIILFILCLTIIIRLFEKLANPTCVELNQIIACFFLVEFFDALIDVPKQILLYACYTTYGSIRSVEDNDILLSDEEDEEDDNEYRDAGGV